MSDSQVFIPQILITTATNQRKPCTADFVREVRNSCEEPFTTRTPELYQVFH
jgi:hypothetical protein